MSDEGTAAETVDSRTASEFCGVKFSNQVPELLTGEETVCIWRQWVSGHENWKMPLLGAIRGSGFIIR